ncbi:hypothetical protein F2P79_011416 [Pimephales promelas]|nr:hypothetical protein F2P79_011416 [Pimephales promelas]
MSTCLTCEEKDLNRLKTALKLILHWFFNSTRGRKTAGYVSRSFSHTFLDPIAPTREKDERVCLPVSFPHFRRLLP